MHGSAGTRGCRRRSGDRRSDQRRMKRGSMSGLMPRWHRRGIDDRVRQQQDNHRRDDQVRAVACTAQAGMTALRARSRAFVLNRDSRCRRLVAVASRRWLRRHRHRRDAVECTAPDVGHRCRSQAIDDQRHTQQQAYDDCDGDHGAESTASRIRLASRPPSAGSRAAERLPVRSDQAGRRSSRSRLPVRPLRRRRPPAQDRQGSAFASAAELIRATRPPAVRIRSAVFPTQPSSIAAPCARARQRACRWSPC